ncbi:hypothetical protein F444_22750 [Phytophthora nicotianae P1976]|uniref:Uncharacterized protein n=1 Tax=Phytophthora nicotianae P1976 TaxID=1317066 RepID=A0A080YWW2_PHYNI|nr:hypothetical protein F444_22750 [Phytophthora nicotianae P1976]
MWPAALWERRAATTGITTDEVVQRQTLRERYLTPQVTTPAEYRERLCQQLTSELDALRASFSETDIRLERRLRLDFAKRQAKQRTSGQRPSRYEAPLPPAPAVDSPTRNHESAATATGPILSPVIDLSSPHSSRGKRVAPGDSVVRPSGGLSPGDPERKRQRRQGSPAAVAPRTPMSSVNEGNLATSQATEHEEDDLPLDSRAASFVEFLSLRSHVRSVSAYVADVDRSSHRLANDLEDVERRVGWLESPQAMQQRVSDLEHPVAQLQGQLDLLVRMQPYGTHPVAMPPRWLYHPLPCSLPWLCSFLPPRSILRT